jgi:hypothetical protein
MKMKSRLMAIAVVCVGISTPMVARASGNDLTGVWQTQVSMPGVDREIKAISICGKDGSFLTVGDRQGPAVPGAVGGTRLSDGVGTWVRRGARDFLLTFYAVMCNKGGEVVGYQKVQGSIRLSESGDKLEASGPSQFLDTKGTVFATIPVGVTGTRLESTSRLTAIR